MKMLKITILLVFISIIFVSACGKKAGLDLIPGSGYPHQYPAK